MLGLLGAALTLLQEPRTAPDSLTPLATGRAQEVTLLYAGPEEVDYRDREGVAHTLPRKKARKLAGPRLEYPDFLSGLIEAYSDQAGATEAFTFAQWCTAHGYHRDAELAYWRALAQDPEFAPAHEALGHRGTGASWLVPLGDDQWAAWPDALRLHGGPDQPWKFTTMHFSIAVSGPLDRAVVIAAAAELLYGRSLSLLQQRARMWDLSAPVRVRVWPARKRGYPEQAAGIDGHWDRATNELHTYLDDASGYARPVNFERLLAEAILDRAAAELTGSPGEIPAWLEAGLGIVLEASTQWGSALPACALGLASQEWVSRDAQLTAPRHAGHVAILARADLLSPRADDLRAQCYTLTHHLLFGENPAFSAPFDNFLRAALRNRGGGTALRSAFGADFDALNASWRAFVLQEGGPRAGERDDG
jgi:hypothetical protein